MEGDKDLEQYVTKFVSTGEDADAETLEACVSRLEDCDVNGRDWQGFSAMVLSQKSRECCCENRAAILDDISSRLLARLDEAPPEEEEEEEEEEDDDEEEEEEEEDDD